MGVILLSCFCDIIVVWYHCWTTSKGFMVSKGDLDVLLRLYDKLKDEVNSSDLSAKSKDMLVTLLSKEASLLEVRFILDNH